MRTYTLFASILVHTLAVAAAFVVPIIATGDLPEPRRALVYEVVTPIAVPPPRRPQPARAQPAAAPHAAPVVEPDAIQPEPARADPFDPPVVAGVIGGVSTEAVMPAPEPPPRPAAVVPAAPVRVGGAIRPPIKIVDVAPEYPAIARSARKGGLVILEAVIGEDGAVRDVRVLRSEPLLDDAAMRAVRQWVFTPTLLNGQPVPVVMTVTVSFSLN